MEENCRKYIDADEDHYVSIDSLDEEERYEDDEYIMKKPSVGMQVLCIPVAALWCLVGYCIFRMQPPSSDDDYYTIEKYALRKPIKKKLKKKEKKANEVFMKRRQNVEELYSKPLTGRSRKASAASLDSAKDSGYSTKNSSLNLPLRSASKSDEDTPSLPDTKLRDTCIKSSQDKLAALDDWLDRSLKKSENDLSNIDETTLFNADKADNSNIECQNEKTAEYDVIDSLTIVSTDTLNRLANLRKCENVVSG
ncbi:DgyrCDS6848 [Dimorphilus gyrociliatus]|uniref:DgyrCDS6848 n=1 Tax=Dimorphilus gyrociliatus TaxID=2664684 RepID=A0A7I8VPE3_9ANNE|nr:DgyrCDS6848 [Dimorphilus gyrociliatus]